jgi:hypothetical protein
MLLKLYQQMEIGFYASFYKYLASFIYLRYLSLDLSCSSVRAIAPYNFSRNRRLFIQELTSATRFFFKGVYKKEKKTLWIIDTFKEEEKQLLEKKQVIAFYNSI